MSHGTPSDHREWQCPCCGSRLTWDRRIATCRCGVKIAVHRLPSANQTLFTRAGVPTSDDPVSQRFRLVCEELTP